MSNRRRRRPRSPATAGSAQRLEIPQEDGSTIVRVAAEDLDNFFTEEDRADMLRVAEAEDAGDLPEALRLLRGAVRVVGNGHERHLAEMVGLGDAAPAWAWGRWLRGSAYRRALMAEDRRVDAAVVQVFAQTYEDDFDSQLGTMMAATDALVEDAVVFDLGVLHDYLDRQVAPTVLSRVPCVRHWGDSPVTVVQLRRLRGDGIVVADHVREREVEVLHTGEALGTDREEWLLGRLVPSGAEPQMVFANRPIAVGAWAGERVAEAIREGGGLCERLDVLGEAIELGVLAPRPGAFASAHSITKGSSLREERYWRQRLDDDDLGPAPRQQELMAEGLDRQTAEALCVLELALELAAQDGPGAVEVMAHHASIALAWPNVRREAASRLTGPGRAPVWRRLAACVPEIHRGPFLQLADGA